MTCAQGLLRLLWGGGRSWSATGLSPYIIFCILRKLLSNALGTGGSGTDTQKITGTTTTRTKCIFDNKLTYKFNETAPLGWGSELPLNIEGMQFSNLINLKKSMQAFA